MGGVTSAVDKTESDILVTFDSRLEFRTHISNMIADKGRNY